MVSGNFINLIGNELLSTGSELFSYLTCLRATTFLMFSVLSIVETIILEIWETTVLPREMFSSGFRLWLKLKNVACLSSQLNSLTAMSLILQL